MQVNNTLWKIKLCQSKGFVVPAKLTNRLSEFIIYRDASKESDDILSYVWVTTRRDRD